MIEASVIFIAFLAIVLVLAWPLGALIVKVMERPEEVRLLYPFRILERAFARSLGAAYTKDMNWKEYFLAFFSLHVLSMIALFLFARLQGAFSFLEPLAHNVSSDTAFNIAISFATNTNWQSCIPEQDMSSVLQTVGITTMQFLAPAAGAAIFFAFARSFTLSETTLIGNFWKDTVRFCLYILLPLSCILSICLVASHVPETFSTSATYSTLESHEEATIPLRMCASQVAIKQLGTNGGGLYNANGAHPFENPTPWSNFLELLAIFLIPVALFRSFAEIVKAPKQALLLLIPMMILLIIAGICALFAESSTIPGIDAFSTSHPLFQAEGNMEGKETRFGLFWSTLWSIATTATSNGSVNSSLSSYMPLGGMMPLLLMQTGEVVFGGIGTGAISAIVFILMAVFAAGLMVGRTPEYLGKKIEAKEMKFVTIYSIFPGAITLIALAYSLTRQETIGLSDILYGFTSCAANNGSSFQSFSADTPFYNHLLAVVMYLCRLIPVLFVLGLAGSLASKKIIPKTAGTFSTETVSFGLWFVFVILIITALTFLPVDTLGPLIQHLNLFFPG